MFIVVFVFGRMYDLLLLLLPACMPASAMAMG
jgi:hypothetical protein